MLCGARHTWAYVNKSDDDYQVTFSFFLSAYMVRKKGLGCLVIKVRHGKVTVI